MFTRTLMMLICCAFPFVAFAQATITSPESVARPQIEAVIESFRAAIIDKDKARFTGLLLHENITWQSVIGESNFSRLREKKPEAVKAKIDLERTPITFIDGIVNGTDRSEEQFRNVRIETDGDIASVFFDYSFLNNGRETNHGKEAWHLLRTEQGWKIASVVWSVNWTPKP
ncbi:MAG TPA: nuclear transport factor 2 family protein [Lysobacter sp.]